jgi:glycosyltransferase involved in cell wall biosynthesis
MAILIVTTEKSGIDKYSQELAKRIDIETIETRRYVSPLEGYRLVRLIGSYYDEVIHLPDQGFARYALFLRHPFVLTVHDLVRSCFGFGKETIIERILLKVDVRCMRKASRIIAVSYNTRNDLIKYLKIPEDRIDVIYNGVDHTIFKPYNIKLHHRPYILYVGSERPRKNLSRLFEAFSKLKSEFPQLKLVKVGTCGRFKKYRTDIEAKLNSLGITQDVIFVDHTPEIDLARYYSSAALLAYPSLYEGFGLPPLEAMACGCPVVTSNTSSLPEVVGDAGIMVNPYDTDSLAEAMRRVLTNQKLRENMIRKGLEQSKKFSWEETARQTLEVYNKVARGENKEIGLNWR